MFLKYLKYAKIYQKSVKFQISCAKKPRISIYSLHFPRVYLAALGLRLFLCLVGWLCHTHNGPNDYQPLPLVSQTCQPPPPTSTTSNHQPPNHASFHTHLTILHYPPISPTIHPRSLLLLRRLIPSPTHTFIHHTRLSTRDCGGAHSYQIPTRSNA
jgi:hypothetical protein